MTDPVVQRPPSFVDWWTHLRREAKFGTVVAGVLLVAAVGGGGVVVGRVTAPETRVALTPCDLFSAADARTLMGTEVEQFRLVDTAPATATEDQLRRVEAVDQRTCAYIPVGEEPDVQKGAVFQIDHRLFESKDDFLEAHEEADEVKEVGDAALITQLGEDGWALSVLVGERTSFALAVSVKTDRDELLEVGREIADTLSAAAAP